MEKSTACWAARPPIFRWPPAISRPSRSSPSWATISLGEDFDLLASRNIDLDGLERVPGGKTFFWAGVYSADMNDRTTLRTDLNVFADFNPKLPESYRTAPYLLLGNIQPALQKSVRAQMPGVKFAGGDTMNYWINDYRDELLETIREWDFLLINDSEARLLSGESQPAPRRRQDHRDGTAHAGDQARRIRRHPLPATAATSSPPATCWKTSSTPPARAIASPAASSATWPAAASSLERRLDFAELRRAVIYGSVMGSFCCEKFGVDRFRTLTRDEIEARYQEFQTCTAF